MKMTPVYKWMRSHPDVVIIELGSAADRALLAKMEQELIASFRNEGLADLNLNDGGDGGAYLITDSTRAKLKESAKNAWNDPDKRARIMANRKPKIERVRMSRSDARKAFWKRRKRKDDK